MSIVDSKKNPLFRGLDADDESEVTEIESLCMNCQDQGITRLMLTMIPFFKEVILCSFSCDKCGFQNCEIQSAGRVQEMGARYKLTVHNTEDLNRQVVKSETALLHIPAVEFEQQASGKGEITTVEGILNGIVNGLRALQPERKEVDPETANKIEEFIEKVEELKKVQEPFEFLLDDPSGNSYLQNPSAPKKDPHLIEEHYKRNAQQEKKLGLVVEEHEVKEEEEEDEIDLKKEVLAFPANCPNCNAPCETNMKLVDIPFFKEIVLMATNCETCGFRENEVKGGAGISDKGTKISLRITDSTDLSRDVLKSDTCGLLIPELDFELVAGTLGGRFTTVEGLLGNIKDQLNGQNSMLVGDSTDAEQVGKMTHFLDKLEKIKCGELLNVHFILDDPAGNSYLQNLYAPEADPEMETSTYERSFNQNEDLGLNDMKTENYKS